MTLIFVTHSPEIAEQFCKRGIVLQNGKVIYDGEIKEATEKYKKSISFS